MLETQVFQAGNYRFITHAFQYSGGVDAMEGYAIERVRFAKLLPLAEGFAAAQAHMARMGRPPTSFCACELRSPGQFTDQQVSAIADYVYYLGHTPDPGGLGIAHFGPVPEGFVGVIFGLGVLLLCSRLIGNRG